MRKKLAIIGASYLQMPLVLKAKEMGIETHCFAWEEGAVCKDICDFFYPISILDKKKIFSICKEIGIDGITSIASDAAVPTISYVAQNMGLISNSLISADISTNKYLMREKLIKNNVNSPKFTLDIEVAKGFSFPLIVKPTDRSGSRGIMKVANVDELEKAIIRSKQESFSETAIIEECIEGVEISVEAISYNGNHHILTITDKVTTGEPYFVELEHHQPTLLDDKIKEKVYTETIKALDALEVKFGASHSEFKITPQGEVFAIEIGARMGGDFIGSDLVYLSTGYDFLKGVIEVALGTFTTPIPENHKYSGVYFLSKETSHLLPYFSEEYQNSYFIRKEVTSSDLKEIQSSGDRCGYIIYQADKKLNNL